MSTDLPFPVRLTDMRAATERYDRADEAGREAMHDALTFHQLLGVGEQAALERRFPDELAIEPTDPEAGPSVRREWDERALVLVRCMLSFGDEVLARHMDLVGHVSTDGHAAVLALTAVGSVVELGLPDAEGRRAFSYRPAPGSDRPAFAGDVVFKEPITLGNRLRIGGRNTSEVIVLATGLGATA
ncbi:MAG: hypothetical protein IT385_17435 [Deltaproteobacteria bacterium]|nr:hypothetical protein [Deltaproteobacteria bacterium]